MMRIKTKRLLGILLSLALVFGLMTGMSMTTYAGSDDPYANLKNTTTVINFDGKEWYLIDYDSDTVTLLIKECIGVGPFDAKHCQIEYSGSDIEKSVNYWYKNNISADAKKAVNESKMFLLTYDQAKAIKNANINVIKCSWANGASENAWWLCTPTPDSNCYMSYAEGETGKVYIGNKYVSVKLGIRPALKLNLSAVNFSSKTKTFILKDGYSVTITPGNNMTKTGDSGAASQTRVLGAIDDVVYKANEGYYFPTDYSVESVNGITVTRNSYTQITVSGTPSTGTLITLTAPTAITKPDAPEAVAVNCSTTDNKDGKLTGVTTAMEYKLSTAENWTAGTGNDITGLAPGTYYVRYKATDTNYASDNQELTIKKFISSTVTFKVVNGSWDEGEGDEATAGKTVTITGHEGDKLKLTADQIPAVGNKPNDTYKAGSWDVTPDTETEITAATTYTYTYAKKDSISQTVTFKVVNGSWDDKSVTDKTVTLTGYEGDMLKLAADQIPAVGSKPNDKYIAGSWDVTPNTETAITEATTYTYTYEQKGESKVTKAPTAKTLTYNGQPQELVNVGEVTGGTMYYAVTTENTVPTDENLYATSIPAETDAGTYTVYYYIKGDDKHEDNGSAKEPTDSVEITIKKAAQDKPEETFTITEASDENTADGKISGFDKAKAYQYSADNGKTWTDVEAESTEIEVKSGAYQIRYAEDKNYEAGQAVTVKVDVKAAEKPSKKSTEKSAEKTTKKTKTVKGVGIISADGKTLTDTDGVKYIVAEKITAKQVKKNASVADKKTAGKYKITKVTKKNGKITGGTVKYMKPYNKNCKTANVKASIKLFGATFKVTAIADKAFKGCENLTKVTIKQNVQTIGKYAFAGCISLTNVKCTSKVLKKIGVGAFSGDVKLTKITLKTTKLKKKTVGKNAIKGTPKNLKISVPKKVKKSYQKIFRSKGNKKVTTK